MLLFYMTAFHLALKEESIDIVKLFLANEKTDLNCHTEEFINKAPIHLAIEYGGLETIKLLVENKNVDINAKCIFIFRYFHDI